MPKPFTFRRYNDWSIRVKLLTITILLIVCSVAGVSLLSYNKYTQDFQKQSAESIQQTLGLLSLNVETYLNDVFRLSLAPYYNDRLMDTLEQPAPNSEIALLEKRRLIEGLIDNLMVIPRKDILSVYLITDEIYRGSRYSASMPKNIDLNDYEWYKKALSTQETIFVPTHLEQIVINPKFRVFSIVRRLNSVKETGKTLGVIKVDANYSGIESICKNVNMGKDGGLFIIDENNALIYTSIKDIPYEQLYHQAMSSKESYQTINFQKTRFLLNKTVIPGSNWTVISLNSIKELNKNAVQTRNVTLILALACSVSAILILLIFTRSFLRPLMDIIRLMKEVKRGNFQVDFPEKRLDEIGYLGSAFNTMILRINTMFEESKKLTSEVYEAKLLQKEAQINALYSQIKPHFLYNTLNMISLTIQSEKNEEAVDYINKLSSIMRNMTNINKEITLESEVNLLEAYLSIQKKRYEDRLEYEINVDRTLFSCVIPTLICQPIVENSVVHGCENKKSTTSIKVSSMIEDNFLILRFEDNGSGINEADLKVLREKLEEKEPKKEPAVSHKRSGVGLINVNKRIKLKYGEPYGLSIESSPGVGTVIEIILPRLDTQRGT